MLVQLPASVGSGAAAPVVRGHGDGHVVRLQNVRVVVGRGQDMVEHGEDI